MLEVIEEKQESSGEMKCKNSNVIVIVINGQICEVDSKLQNR